DHDAASADVHQRVCGAEIDRHVMHAERRRQVAAGGVATGTVSTESDDERVSEGPWPAPLALARLLTRVLRDRLGEVQRGGDDPVLLLGVGNRIALPGGGTLRAADVAEVQGFG